MIIQENLSRFLAMYYQDANIPLYLYTKERELLLYFPEDAKEYPIPDEVFLSLKKNSENVAYLSTDCGVCYCGLRLLNYPEYYLCFGPINAVPYTKDLFHKLYNDYVIPYEEQGRFQRFLLSAPQLSMSSFLNKLLFLNYCLNLEEKKIADFFPFQGDSNQNNLPELVYYNKEHHYQNKSHEVEEIILNMIRTGNVEGFENIPFTEEHTHTGITGPNALRKLKNDIIIMTTLATRAAIDGGLDPELAYGMSDAFILKAEQSNDYADLSHLMAQIPYTFTEKVYESQTPLTQNDILQKAMRFIQQNTNRPISVNDVANYVGFSRSYFSTYFKKELGFSVAAFIQRCRLEESKQLLRYTAKPISVISNYLCFSSQSHFQKAFKKQYSCTPLEWRKGKFF